MVKYEVIDREGRCVLLTKWLDMANLKAKQVNGKVVQTGLVYRPFCGSRDAAC